MVSEKAKTSLNVPYDVIILLCGPFARSLRSVVNRGSFLDAANAFLTRSTICLVRVICEDRACSPRSTLRIVQCSPVAAPCDAVNRIEGQRQYPAFRQFLHSRHRSGWLGLHRCGYSHAVQPIYLAPLDDQAFFYSFGCSSLPRRSGFHMRQ